MLTEVPAPPRELGALARAIAAEPVADAISPVVLIGLVRLAEFLAAAAIGAVTYIAYVYPSFGESSLAYSAAILLISGAAIFASPGLRDLTRSPRSGPTSIS